MVTKISARTALAGLILASTPMTLSASTGEGTETLAASEAQPDPKQIEKQRKQQMKEWRKLYGVGPYPDEVDAYASSKPDALRPFYKTLYYDGEHNAVVNFERLGLAAMQLGHLKEAEEAFDAAISRIETIYSKDEQAQKARSSWSKEGIKDFKGEPYERAMAYYYRGILHLIAGQFEDARVMFMNAEYQDTISEAEEFQSDFAVMNFLTGWATRCAGNASGAADYFTAAQKADPTVQLPADGDNFLVLAELGKGPVKVKRGDRNELLAFEASETAPTDDIKVFASQQELALKPVSSVFAQATTRGGRPIDSILKGKANFKSTTETVGQVGAMTGMTIMSQAQATQNVGMANVGAAVSMLGMFSSIMSSGVKPDADIRMWDTLPDSIALITIKRPGEGSGLEAKFAKLPQGGSAQAPPVLNASHPSCGVFWTRSRSAVDVDPAVPGNDADVVKARKKQKTALDKDTQFRAALRSSESTL